MSLEIGADSRKAFHVAYDLLFRKQTRTNWSLPSRRRCSYRGAFFLAEYTFAPDPLPTTDDEKQAIARLAVLKMKVDAGDKKAMKEWRAAGKKIVEARKLAAKGDPKAKRLMQVLSESGIFASVQAMNIAGVGAYAGVPLYPYQQQTPFYGGDPGLILAWPIIALIEFFSDRSDKKAAVARDRNAAAQAVNEAIANGLVSGSKFANAAYLTFGWNADYGTDPHSPAIKYNHQVDAGVPEVRASVVKKVRAGDPKAVAFYKAVLKSGYTPQGKDPGLAQMSGSSEQEDNLSSAKKLAALSQKIKWDHFTHLYTIAKQDQSSEERETVLKMIDRAKQGDKAAQRDVNLLKQVRASLGDGPMSPK